MNADADLIALYSTRILALAADMPRAEPLPEPGATVRRRAPLCGSSVTVGMTVRGGVVTDYGQDVKACALGQAAASVVGANIVGCSRDQIRAARDQLLAMLTEGGPVPDAPFDGLESLIPARDYRNRHGSIMLALEASLEAFDQAVRGAGDEKPPL